MSFQAMRTVLLAERHGDELLGLALQQAGEPGRGLGAAALDLLDVSCRPRHQGGAQALVAGAGDAAVRILPAVEWSLGVRPTQAAHRRPDRKAAGR
jgi:hypothetical protein